MAGRNIYSFENILDFGSGSGRVIANFKDAPETCHFYGTDIDAEMVLWCEENIPGIRWSINGHTPPLAYLDNTFDLIYAISVFTHLDEGMQNAWLGELHRIAKPGAILILTVLGDGIVGKPSPNDADKLTFWICLRCWCAREIENRQSSRFLSNNLSLRGLYSPSMVKLFRDRFLRASWDQ